MRTTTITLHYPNHHHYVQCFPDGSTNIVLNPILVSKIRKEIHYQQNLNDPTRGYPLSKIVEILSRERR